MPVVRLKSATFTIFLVSCLVSMEARSIEPIKIGLIASTTGFSAEQGVLAVNGARLAADEVNKSGGVGGRMIELEIEDDQSTNPGAVLAFSKLSSQGRLAAVIGPIRSTQIQAMSPSIAKAGVPTLIGGSDTALTHVNNHWLFRLRPNDSFSAKVIADFGINSLKAKKWAIVYSTDAYGAGGAKALTEALKDLGVTPVMSQAFTGNAQDFATIALGIKNSGADLISGYIGMPPDLAIFAKQLGQLGMTVPILIGQGASVTARRLAGSALFGSYAVIDFTPDASAATREFSKKYRQTYGIDPDFFSSWTYDAIQILALAIKKAGKTDAEAIRNAILDIRGYEGVEGTYAFDQNGDGLHGYNVVRNEEGKLVFIKRVDVSAR
jgi:branched-chain amino acid transport system substrate-binding protein